MKAQASYNLSLKEEQSRQASNPLVDTDDSDDELGIGLAKAESLGNNEPIVDPFQQKNRIRRESKLLQYYSSSSDESVGSPGSQLKSSGSSLNPSSFAAAAAAAATANDSSDDDDDQDMWLSDDDAKGHFGQGVTPTSKSTDAQTEGKMEEVIDVDADVSTYVPSSPRKKAKSDAIINPYKKQNPSENVFETPVKSCEIKSNPGVYETDEKDQEIALLKKQLLEFQSRNDAISEAAAKGEFIDKATSKHGGPESVSVLKSDDTPTSVNSSSNDTELPSPGKWPSLDTIVKNKITSLSTPLKGSKAVITVEVSHPISDRKTNEDVHLIIFSSSGMLSWFIKPEAVKMCAEVYLTQGLGGEVASVYRDFTETPIRKIPYGPNVLHRRNSRPNDNGNLPYPTMKMITWLRVNKKGFGVDLCVKNFGQTLQAIFADCKPAAYILNDYLSENAITLYDRFVQGLYRPAPEKKEPYENTEQLLEFFEMALEKTFKFGFKRIVTGISLDKFLPDFEIKNFLVSLGYTSFEDVPEDEKRAIYRSTNFPIWESIEQEGFM